MVVVNNLGSTSSLELYIVTNSLLKCLSEFAAVEEQLHTHFDSILVLVFVNVICYKCV